MNTKETEVVVKRYPYDTAIDDIYYSPYCPNCGAKMEVDE